MSAPAKAPHVFDMESTAEAAGRAAAELRSTAALLGDALRHLETAIQVWNMGYCRSQQARSAERVLLFAEDHLASIVRQKTRVEAFLSELEGAAWRDD